VKPPGARNSARHSKEVAQREPVRRGCCFLPYPYYPRPVLTSLQSVPNMAALEQVLFG